MTYWRDHIPTLKRKVDASSLTESQVRDATDAQVKNFLNLTDNQFSDIRKWLPRIKNHVIRHVRKKIEAAMYASIVAALSTPQKQWLKAQDMAEFNERIQA